MRADLRGPHYFTLNDSVSVSSVLASVTRALKYHVPFLVHLPEMTPLAASNGALRNAFNRLVRLQRNAPSCN